MEKVELRLNDFLFNAGMLGLYRVLEICDEDYKIEISGNTLLVDKSIFEKFEDKYIKAMINTYEKDTKWYSIISKKMLIKKIEQEEDLEREYNFIKKCIESASYKSGYEILKTSENPYDLLKQLKKENDLENKKIILLKIIEHIENNKETYCMKDIIYTKINCFWNNVAFLNRTANKNDIKGEYKKTFVDPVLKYFNVSKTGFTCIECGNSMSKSEAFGMSWLNDVGVDISRKKSGFWNFNEDSFICPICNLVYSCIPLGFLMIGSNGIFINNNENFQKLKDSNDTLTVETETEITNFEKTYGRIIYNFINKTDQVGNKNMATYEINNIQVIKRIGNKDNQKYEFNLLSRDKLDILKKTENYFSQLITTGLYQEVLNNVINGQKQYKIIDRLLTEANNNNVYNINFVKNILMIQLISMGGVNMEERKKYIEDMIAEGEKLQKYFYKEEINNNKLKSYIYKLQGALRADSQEEFLKLFTLFYGSLSMPMPNCKAVTVMIESSEYFRILGYSYIYGMQKRVNSSVKKEENQDEE